MIPVLTLTADMTAESKNIEMNTTTPPPSLPPSNPYSFSPSHSPSKANPFPTPSKILPSLLVTSPSPHAHPRTLRTASNAANVFTGLALINVGANPPKTALTPSALKTKKQVLWQLLKRSLSTDRTVAAQDQRAAAPTVA
ncbi:hypothetical protein K435DRAFT_870170 [Dendrothele bispora CBS 962.96]|uniref:Uncharacterized protein n=1 Tax=Dendrothele bispora (strain CBS 962.96) TaxID=1314807 RepID=A0A4S8L7A1_DENBC|nr:hypothetical protein K435DRAFT_870170 [Dendrothele bispora CBS 962.96]